MIEIGQAYIFNYPELPSLMCPEYLAHRGQLVTVIRELVDDKVYPSNTFMYEVEALDGWRGNVWPIQLIPVEGG
jgi:hypothetical protein